MTEITEPTLKLCWNEHAVRRAAEVLRAAGLQLMAEDVEAQFPKPAIEEPTEFGSIVRAGSPQDAPATEFDLWTPTPRRKHYWMSQSGLCEVWSELTDVEVLRVGVGEPEPREEWRALDIANAQNEAYSRGYEDGVQSNLPSPVDRSCIDSALREAMAKISLREGRLIGEDHSYELADAVMRHLEDDSDASRELKRQIGEAAAAGFDAGVTQVLKYAHARLQRLLDEALTAERKNAFEKAIQAVEELAP